MFFFLETVFVTKNFGAKIKRLEIPLQTHAFSNFIILLQIKTKNSFCIRESFKTNISHHFFHYKINFLNSQHENTNPQGDFCS